MSGGATPQRCDGTSVGVIIDDGCQRYLVFEHTTGRPGVAPVSGHIDGNPSPEPAACAEAFEETGLAVSSARLIDGGWRRNSCRREPGPDGIGHTWWVFTVTVRDAVPAPSPRETRNMRWVTRGELQRLAACTVAYARGMITDEEWAAEPGIAPVWVHWLTRALLISVPPEDVSIVDELAARPMSAGQSVP
jgi:8-oxo-dGTP pyrophosphatase MutT (NUDIX family)